MNFLRKLNLKSKKMIASILLFGVVLAAAAYYQIQDPSRQSYEILVSQEMSNAVESVPKPSRGIASTGNPWTVNGFCPCYTGQMPAAVALPTLNCSSTLSGAAITIKNWANSVKWGSFNPERKTGYDARYSITTWTSAVCPVVELPTNNTGVYCQFSYSDENYFWRSKDGVMTWVYGGVSTGTQNVWIKRADQDWAAESTPPICCPAGTKANLAENLRCDPIAVSDNSCRAGNPSNPSTGRKEFTENDYSGAGEDELYFDRTYSSTWDYGMLGNSLGKVQSTFYLLKYLRDPITLKGQIGGSIYSGGWHHDYAASLKIGPERDPSAAVFLAGDGSMTRFHYYACPANAVSFPVSTNVISCYCTAEAAKSGSVWGGSTAYTADSNICRAALHAGAISSIKGGFVRFTREGGLATYTGSTKNSVTTSSYGSYSGSYTINLASTVIPPWAPDDNLIDRLENLTTSNGLLTGYKVFIGGWAQEYYLDINGKLTKIVKRNGQTTTLSYVNQLTSTGLSLGPVLSAVTNHFGRKLVFSYVPNTTYISTVSVMLGTVSELIVTYSYDTSFRLSKVTWSNGLSKRYVYEDGAHPSALTGVFDERGIRVKTYKYNIYRQVIESYGENLANKFVFSYLDSNTTKIQDYSSPTPTETIQTFQLVGNRRRLVSSTGTCKTCGTNNKSAIYNSLGLPLKTIDQEGIPTFYLYDSLGRVVSEARMKAIRADGNTTFDQVSGYPNDVINAKAYVWHPKWNLPTNTAEANLISWYTYDDVTGRLLKKEWVRTDDATGAQRFSTSLINASVAKYKMNSEIYSYDTNGLMTSINISGPEESYNQTLTYGPQGQIINVKDSRNPVEGLANFTDSYDLHGRFTRGTNVDGVNVSFAFDKRGRATSYSLNADKTSYTYDVVGRIQSILSPSGSKAELTYKNDLIESLFVDGVNISTAAFDQVKPKKGSNWVSRLLIPNATAQLPPVPIVPAMGGNSLIWMGAAEEARRGNSTNELIAQALSNNAPTPWDHKEARILVAKAILNCISDCDYYSTPTVTIKTKTHLLVHQHVEKFVSVYNKKSSYFYNSFNILKNAQNIVDKAHSEYSAGLNPKPAVNANGNIEYYTRWPSMVGMSARKPTNCVLVAFSNSCRTSALGLKFNVPLMLLNPVFKNAQNEVVTMYPVNTNKCPLPN